MQSRPCPIHFWQFLFVNPLKYRNQTLLPYFPNAQMQQQRRWQQMTDKTTMVWKTFLLQVDNFINTSPSNYWLSRTDSMTLKNGILNKLELKRTQGAGSGFFLTSLSFSVCNLVSSVASLMEEETLLALLVSQKRNELQMRPAVRTRTVNKP